MTQTPTRVVRRPGSPALPHRDLWDTAWAARTALRAGATTLTYADLARRVERFAERHLGTARTLVLVELDREVDGVVAYLAALTHGHPVLVTAPGESDRLAAYAPGVVVREGGVEATTHATPTHPELALLLATSGSTGTPKLVRLGAEGVAANATAIAEYLDLTADDVGVSALPLHYCYGLSVLHSHLAVGAATVLTDRSVVDPGFWEEARAAGVTSLPGVPHTFDLLDRLGFSRADLPTLRTLTQAGGALSPAGVRRWAAQGRREGFDLVVMYGQTEATARMAWLPPHLAEEHPSAVGVAVPGGVLRLDPLDDADHPDADHPATDHGEIVYSGPNVMLGYAETAADLARGRDVHELRTGDLGRWRDGLLEVVGRRDRCVKLFGRRLDLGALERTLDARVHLLVREQMLHAFTTGRTAGLADRLRDLAGLPPHAVVVHRLDELPRTPSGKPCGTALRALADRVATDAEAAPDPVEALRREYALVLGRPDARPDQSFTDLGGDSLSFVELSTRLSRRLDALPADWHRRPLGSLAPTAPVRRRRLTVAMDTATVLRALAIVLIVGSHTELVDVMGGAHVLLVVAGWNLARFHLDARSRAARLRGALAAVARIALPSSALLGLISLTGHYRPTTALYLNGLLGPDSWTDDWQLWFLEAWVWLSLAALAVLAVPAVDRLDRRHPFALPCAVLLATLALRFALVGIEAGPTERYAVPVLAWLLVAGWAGARAATTPQRLLVLGAIAAGVAGMLGDPARETVVLVGAAALLLLPTLRVPRLLAGATAAVAAASLGIYLTHWQVYPHLEAHTSLGATLASLAVGLVYVRATRPLERLVGRRVTGPRRG